MNARRVQGVFDSEAGIVAATRRARSDGFSIVDVFTPYAVHGLDEAMGVRRSRLPWACFLMGATGALLAVWFQFWTSAVDWPIDVGGKPWNSLPAFVPIMFEITVLFAGLGVVLALFVRTGLIPGRREILAAPQVTDDRFVLLLRLEGAEHTVDDARAMLAEQGAIEVEDYVEEDR